MPGVNAPIYPANNSFNSRPGGVADSNIFGSGANDTTTWQVASGAAPVHLLTGQ